MLLVFYIVSYILERSQIIEPTTEGYNCKMHWPIEKTQ